MTVADLTTELLRQICDLMHQTRTELGERRDGLSARVEQTNIRIDLTRTEMIEKFAEHDARLSTLADRGIGITEAMSELRLRVERLEPAEP